MIWEFAFPRAAMERAHFPASSESTWARVLEVRQVPRSEDLEVKIQARTFDDACRLLNECVRWKSPSEAPAHSSG